MANMENDKIHSDAEPVLQDRPALGMLLFCAALVLFVSMGSTAKWLSQTYPTEQVIWARYFFHVIFILVIFPTRIFSLFKTKKLPVQIARSIVVFVATATGFWSMQYMQLDELSAIGFLTPLMVTGLSVLVLKEKVGPRRWVAVVIGLAAVLIVLRPTGENFGPWYILPMIMAFCYAVYQIMTRMIRGAAPQINSLFYTAIVGAALATIPAMLVWQAPALEHWPLFIMMGILGGVGHLLMIKGFEMGEASLLTPFGYTEMIWSIIAGFLLFSDVPNIYTMIGAGIIMSSGMYVFYREQQAAKKNQG